jgi:uncharacterized membrane protein AbrB (regulator of aidB expression)
VSGFPDFFVPEFTSVSLMEKGARVEKSAYVAGTVSTVYTVPSGRIAYLIAMSYYSYNRDTTYVHYAQIVHRTASADFYIKYLAMPPGSIDSDVITGGIVRMNPGESLIIQTTNSNLGLYTWFMIIEVS